MYMFVERTLMNFTRFIDELISCLLEISNDAQCSCATAGLIVNLSRLRRGVAAIFLLGFPHSRNKTETRIATKHFYVSLF